MQLLKLGGDLLIGIALAEPKRRDNLRNSLLYDYELLIAAAEDARLHPLTEQGQRELEQNIAKLRDEVTELLRGRTPFHWPLEFPEVFAGRGDEAGFAAIMGNPPFQGGTLISGVLGTNYREYLVEYIAKGKRGARADLCAYFFLQASYLVRHNGQCSLLATNTISQGDTREVGLDQIVANGFSIFRAIPSRKWPGEASLEVAHIWFRSGRWRGLCLLDEKVVVNITSFLTASDGSQEKSYRLLSNINKSFGGVKIYGQGFLLDPVEAQILIEKNPLNKNVLFPYLNGEDLNSRSDQSPSRWTINFFDWPLEKAENYFDCLKIVREKVKVERETSQCEKSVKEKWWQYQRPRPALYTAITDMERVLTIPLVSKYMICSWEPTNIVYSHALGVVATEADADFALIQCTFHDYWARQQGSTLEARMRYTPSDCFETFPFPTNTDNLESIGERYYTHRQSIMLARQEGLTATYNRFHNPAEHSADIAQLRELHREMDDAVARAYGWEDLRLGHGFHETKQGMRWTISEEARREVLDRLLLLNHQRHAEEVAAGLVDASGKPLKGKAKGAKKGVGKQRVGEAVTVKPQTGELEQGNLF